MIKTLWLQNYGPFKLAELELGTLTVLVGPNASGKSIALKTFIQNLPPDDSHLERMRNRGATFPTDPVAIGLRFISVDLSKGDAQTIVWKSPLIAENPDFQIEPKEIEAKIAIKWPPEVVHLQLHPDALRHPSYVDLPVPIMHNDGYGLASALASMKLSDTRGFDALMERVESIVPVFEGLRFTRTRVDVPKRGDLYGDELIFDMKNARGLHPKFVSDGTLFTLGLLTSLVQRSRQEPDSSNGFLILIDEIERGLHPRALGELISHLRRLAKDFNAQILATSHSPYLLDALETDEVRLTGFLEDGSATIRKLSDHPEFDRWKDVMTPGEFWSTVGEDWIR